MTTPTATYPHLFEPLTIRGRTFRNRAIMGSMHTGLEDSLDDIPKLAAYFKERADGGIAAVVTGGYSPNMEGNLTPYGLPFNNEEIAQAHRTVTDAVHSGGALAFLQLLHAGRYGYHPMVKSASSTQAAISPFPATELTDEEVRATIQDYATAASYAVQAGYDGVQIMGSEGYLINQFLAARTNHREDHWGGSAEKRRNFPLEIVRAVRAAVPEDFIIDFRISVVELVEEGQTQAEIVAFAKALEDAGVDMLSSGIGWHEARIPTIVTSVPRAAFTWATRAVAEAVDVPVVASNRINTPGVAESILAAGDADLVSMARPLLADANFMARVAAGEEASINHCIACNQACLDHTFSNKRASCLVNPRACYETELVLQPVVQRKRVAVIGAGVAGLFAAESLAQRGHDVEVFEAAPTIGGQFQLAMRIPGKEEFVQTLHAAAHRVDALGVPVHVNAPRVPEELLEAGFEEVIVATGVTPRVPDFPGVAEGIAGEFAGVQVVTYSDLLSGKATAGRAVAVIGAGGIGFDVAEFLLDAPIEAAVAAQPHTGAAAGASADGSAVAVVPQFTPDPQTVDAWNAQWGVDQQAEVVGNLSAPQPHRAARQIIMLQRKTSSLGKGLGKTTGWVHRAQVAMGGVLQVPGVTYEAVNAEGLRVTVPANSKALKYAAQFVVDGTPVDPAAETDARVTLQLPVDTVVLCTGQESSRPAGWEPIDAPTTSSKADAWDANEQDEFASTAPSNTRDPRVHIIGGADVAAELDAKRAIRQAVITASRI